MTLTRKPRAVWNVCPEIDAAQGIIAQVYKDHGAEAVVTSAKDSKHSKESAHHQEPGDKRPAKAIDLRIWNLFQKDEYKTKEWWGKAMEFSEELARRLNEGRTLGNFYVILEKDHIHCEFSDSTPNIKAFAAGQYGYITKEVREALV